MSQWKWGMKHGCRPAKLQQITTQQRPVRRGRGDDRGSAGIEFELFVNNQSICQCNAAQQISSASSLCPLAKWWEGEKKKERTVSRRLEAVKQPAHIPQWDLVPLMRHRSCMKVVSGLVWASFPLVRQAVIIIIIIMILYLMLYALVDFISFLFQNTL